MINGQRPYDPAATRIDGHQLTAISGHDRLVSDDTVDSNRRNLT